jgi:hypothetical protein
MWLGIPGGRAPATEPGFVTVSTAPLEVMLPTLLETTTLKIEPESAITVVGVVWLALVAPASVDPFLYHW